MFAWLKNLQKTRSSDACLGRTQAEAEKIQELEERVRVLERDYMRLNSKVYRDINRAVESEGQDQRISPNPLTNLNPGDIIDPSIVGG